MINESPEFKELVKLFGIVNIVTAQIQNETACAMLLNNEVKEDLEKQMRKTESLNQERIQKGVNAFVSCFPLASMTGQNMFMNALAMHGTITTDKSTHLVIEKINELTIDKHYGYN